jgi:hypothetical protein
VLFYKPDQAQKVADALSPVVLKVSASDVLRGPYEPEVVSTPVQSAEVLRETDIDRTSAPAQEIAKDRNTAEVLDALDAPAPPVGPLITPDGATAFNQPPTPDMGPTIKPNEATAYEAPEQPSNEDILAASAKYGIDKVAPVEEVIPAQDATVASLEIPDQNGEKTATSEQVNESELATLDGGILDTETVNFARAVSNKEGIPYNPDGKNVLKLLVKFGNRGNEIDWTKQQAGVRLTEIKNFNDLNIKPEPGTIGTVPYDNVKSILQGIMTYQITEDSMTDEQYKAVMEYAFNNPVEPPTEY